MRPSLRIGAGPLIVVAALPLCGAAIAMSFFSYTHSGSIQNLDDRAVSARIDAGRSPLAGRAKIIDGIVTAFKKQIDEAVESGRPVGQVGEDRYDRFMGSFKLELYGGLVAHLEGYSDAELQSLVKPQWDLVASDLETGERFREWLRDAAPEMIDRVSAAKRALEQKAERVQRQAESTGSVSQNSDRGSSGQGTSPRRSRRLL